MRGDTGGGLGRSDRLRVAYPDALFELESALLARRTSVDPSEQAQPRVGLALSGGGVRSATFGLGVLQALADRNLLSKIHFLSTVSGGGYIGSFLSRLYSRPEVDAATVERELRPSATTATPALGCLGWLRENGRYLAPSGTGDLLAAGAVMLRNWVSVHVVVAFFCLMVLLLIQWVRHVVPVPSHAWIDPFNAWLGAHMPVNASAVWFTPFAALLPVIVAFWLIPAGWAYWLSPGTGRPGAVAKTTTWAWLGTIPIAAVAMGYVWSAATPGEVFFQELLVAVGGATAATFVFAWLRALFVGEWSALSSYVRRDLAAWLKTGLVAFAGLLAFTIVDSLGQSLYVAAISDRLHVVSWISGAIGGFATLSAAARQITVMLPRQAPSQNRWTAPLPLVGAVVIGLLLLIGYDALSHALTWRFGMPSDAPAPLRDEFCSATPESCGNWTTSATSQLLLVLLALNVAIGRTWSFVNDSTFQPLYSSRLARAYLGASNPRRVRGRDTVRVTDVIADDDTTIADLWWNDARASAPSSGAEPNKVARMFSTMKRAFGAPTPGNAARDDGIFARGAPLHLINVTINETLDSRTGIQNNDRRGIGLAIGPAGLSAGVRHHCVLTRESVAIAPGPESFRMFDYKNTRGDAPTVPFEELTLSQWVGISGAAFSTGLGARTNLGLSLLAGLFNVRLGYWWNSGVRPGRRVASLWQRMTAWFASKSVESFRQIFGGGLDQPLVGRAFADAMPLQSYLIDEFVARFHGTGRQWWYLSDGGHFENLAAYELIRRRVPLIVIVDAEADPDYQFEGLSNLVRKARLDFDADIRFVEAADVPSELRPCFGSLDQLRRGKWAKDVPFSAEALDVVVEADRARRSGCHACIAKVHYEGSDSPETVIVYIKPTLVGDEPIDVRAYHTEHVDFPHEATSNQFFGEAQWESYRKLGEWIGGKIFVRDFAAFLAYLTARSRAETETAATPMENVR